MQWILNWDSSVLFWMQEHMLHPVTNGFMVAVTTLGNAGLCWIVLGFVLLFIKKERRAGLTILCALVLCFLIGNVLLKNIVARPRPFQEFEGVALLIAPPKDYSFPSGHAMSSFAAASALTLFHKKWGLAALVLAAFIALSRMVLFVHYPSDVLMGSLIGVAIVVLLFRDNAPFGKRLKTKFCSGHEQVLRSR